MTMLGITTKHLRNKGSSLPRYTSKVVKRFVSARLELPNDVAGTRTKIVSICVWCSFTLFHAHTVSSLSSSLVDAVRGVGENLM